MSEWQPINTLQRNLRVVGINPLKKYIAIGVLNDSGEFEVVSFNGNPAGIGFYPTHWMGLPPSPKDIQEQSR